MHTDPGITFQLIQLEHALRLAEAERGRLAAQAAALRGRQPVARAIGQGVGSVLVAVGKRLQGRPRTRGAGAPSLPASTQG